MTIDAILEIRKAEEEAEQIRQNALSEARAVLADAKAQADRIKNEAVSGGRLTAEEKALLAEQRAVMEIEKIKYKDAAECEQIEKSARAKFAEAAGIIAERIVKLNVDR